MTRAGRAKTLLTAVVAGVVVAHLWLTSALAERMRLAPPPEGMQRMQAQYVSQITLSAPPAAAPSPPAKPERRAASPTAAPPQPAASTASAPDEADAARDAADDTPPDAHLAEATLPEPAEPAASAASDPVLADSVTAAAADAAAQTAAAEPGFEWPLATQVRFKLEGHYRGPVQGEATVEWLREGDRYQVHVDAIVGPSFAPIGSWRLSSEGFIQAEGLAPRRYENANRLFIRGTRTRATTMGSDEVQLSNGNRQGRPTGLQDPASLLIQLAYGFIQDPSRLKAGTLIELPVATTRKMDTMVFEVQPEETLDTPVGRIKAVRVKPRHALLEKGNAPADIWFAPELQYLPVRILVQVEGQPTFMQLSLSAPPMQVRKPSATP